MKGFFLIDLFLIEDPKDRILWSAEHGRLDMVKELLEMNSDLVNVVDEDNYTPLHRAAYNNHVDIIKVFSNFHAIRFLEGEVIPLIMRGRVRVGV